MFILHGQHASFVRGTFKALSCQFRGIFASFFNNQNINSQDYNFTFYYSFDHISQVFIALYFLNNLLLYIWLHFILSFIRKIPFKQVTGYFLNCSSFLVPVYNLYNLCILTFIVELQLIMRLISILSYSLCYLSHLIHFLFI